MRFRLLGLLVLAGVLPPILAGAWFAVRWLSKDGNIAVLIPLGCFLAAAVLAANLKRIIRFVASKLW